VERLQGEGEDAEVLEIDREAPAAFHARLATLVKRFPGQRLGFSI